jgi:hypothetical protein
MELKRVTGRFGGIPTNFPPGSSHIISLQMLGFVLLDIAICHAPFLTSLYLYPHSAILKTVASGFPETVVVTYQSAWCHTPEDTILTQCACDVHTAGCCIIHLLCKT